VTLPVRITEVSYFDTAYRGDLIIARGVLYYLPWVNVALEEKQNRDKGQLDRLFPLSFVIEVIWGLITSYGAAHTEPRLNHFVYGKTAKVMRLCKRDSILTSRTRRTNPPNLWTINTAWRTQCDSQPPKSRTSHSSLA
jgi:hypothetical protein